MFKAKLNSRTLMNFCEISMVVQASNETHMNEQRILPLNAETVSAHFLWIFINFHLIIAIVQN